MNKKISVRQSPTVPAPVQNLTAQLNSGGMPPYSPPHRPERLFKLPRLRTCGFSTGLLFLILLIVPVMPLRAQPATETPEIATDAEASAAIQEADAERKRRNVAVALNYCRASFHRIRKYPTDEVMQEEQQKILNNLNLNGIQDEQIIRLYADVLTEIGQMQLTDKESELFTTKFQKSLRQELAFDSLSVGLDLLTGQYLGAVRTGANSWWDYRNLQWNRDTELLKLEKTRANSVVQKSTNFLDTFWKLTQANNIPDRWLVRSTDLDDLEQAMNEADPQVRLRVLRRMEPYMECYPPYWYYLARTQQAVGELTTALQTYQRLEKLAEGHFRRDDMMASALTNQAVIQAHLGNPEAVQTAQRALTHSTQVWEANLVCGRILQQAGRLADAEDAILRNLDVQLESQQSTVALLGFYYDTNNTTKLAEYLADEKVIANVPPPVLIRYASRLEEQQTSDVIWTALRGSMSIEPQLCFGSDSIVVTCHPVWGIGRSKIGLHTADGRVIPGELTKHGHYEVVRFAKVAEFGSVLSGPVKLPPLKLEIQYGDKEPIMLAFDGQTHDALPLPASSATVTARAPATPRTYRMTSAQWGQKPVSTSGNAPRTAQAPPETSAETTLPLRAPFRTSDLGSRAVSEEIRTAHEKPAKTKAAADSVIR